MVENRLPPCLVPLDLARIESRRRFPPCCNDNYGVLSISVTDNVYRGLEPRVVAGSSRRRIGGGEWGLVMFALAVVWYIYIQIQWVCMRGRRHHFLVLVQNHFRGLKEEEGGGVMWVAVFFLLISSMVHRLSRHPQGVYVAYRPLS